MGRLLYNAKAETGRSSGGFLHGLMTMTAVAAAAAQQSIALVEYLAAIAAAAADRRGPLELSLGGDFYKRDDESRISTYRSVGRSE